jgi:outer membrane biosynthesis protein TonB
MQTWMLGLCLLGFVLQDSPAATKQEKSIANEGFVEDPLKGEPGAPKRVPNSPKAMSKLGSGGTFPEEARTQGIQGDVIVEVWVDKAGIPFRSTAIWGHPTLRSYAERIGKNSRFNPYLEGGVAIPVRFRILVGVKTANNPRPYQSAPKEFQL